MHNIKLSKMKLQFGMTVPFAGILIGVGDRSYKHASQKVEAINELSLPMTVTEVKSLLGTLVSFKNFIPHFTMLLTNIRDLSKKRYSISMD